MHEMIRNDPNIAMLELDDKNISRVGLAHPFLTLPAGLVQQIGHLGVSQVLMVLQHLQRRMAGDAGHLEIGEQPGFHEA